MESEYATMGGGDHFVVEDLLDFTNETTAPVVDDVTATATATATTTTTGGSSNSSTSSTAVDDVTSAVTSNGGGPHLAASGGGDVPFSADLCVPSDDLAELEWLSNFVEESFSSEDLHKLQLFPGVNSAFKTNKIRSESDPKFEKSSELIHYYRPEPIHPIDDGPNPLFNPDLSVPGKARSKRSRAAPGNWSSRLLLLTSSLGPGPTRPVPVHGLAPKPARGAGPKKKSGPRSRSGHELPNGEARRCLHCATDKTPQWRTGPLGPKTLCNACGVRYKSGRLVPEYRPAASPTFVTTKHSNSHRKVMELRRQKDIQKQHQLILQQQQQLMHDPNSMIFDPPNSDDYLIHQHIGPDFRQLI